jgi:hypothetical protein
MHSQTSALDVSGQLHAPTALLPGIGGWVDPRAGLDAMVKTNIPNSCRKSNPGRPARSLVFILTVIPTL